MNEGIAIFAGIGLAAACGLRVFLPWFVASLAIRHDFGGIGGFELGSLLGAEMEWLGSPAVTLALGIATAAEIVGYYVPWLDNLLDTVATPLAVVAGTLIAFAFLPGGIEDPAAKWFLAAIAGGGTAGIVQAGTVILRGASSAATGGLANPAVSTAEAGGSTAASLLTVFSPLIAGGLAIALAAFLLIRLAALRRTARDPSA
jgi:hypothetical protein